MSNNEMRFFKIEYEIWGYYDQAKTHKITLINTDHYLAKDWQDAGKVAEIIAISRSAAIISLTEIPQPGVK